MYLVSKVKYFFSNPTGTAPRSKAKSTDSPRPIPQLKIHRDQGDWRWKGRRAPPTPPTLSLVDIGSQVHECLQDIDGLDFRDDDYTIVAVSKLSEKALEPIVKAIGILMGAKPEVSKPEECELRAACTLISMLEPSVRLALLDRCPGHLDVLVNCKHADIRKAMDRALFVAGRDALGRKDFSGFLKLLPYCSPQARASLIERFPPLTIEMAKALDEKMLIKAVDARVERIIKLNAPKALLIEHDSLLSIAGDLQDSDLPRAVVMKCIIWESLGTEGVPDPAVRGELKRLQYKALLPPLTPELVERIEDELNLAVSGVVEEQGAMSQNLKVGVDRLPVPATPVHEFFDFLDAKDARDWNKAASLIHGSQNDGFRQGASRELFAAVSERLEEEGFHVGSEPSQYIEALLEGLGFPSQGGLVTQMIAALPMLCDADHSFVLHVILGTAPGKALVAQALMDCLLERPYGNATVASLVMALADRVDLQSILDQDRWASATTKVVIDLVMSGVPREAEAAEKILAHSSKIARESLRAQMRDVLPTLCDARLAIELDLILKTKSGERLVAQAVVDYLLQGELNDASVSSLFKALAHRVDLRTTDVFLIDVWKLANPMAAKPIVRQWDELINNLGRVRLDGECTQLLNQWRPGWRLLLLLRLKDEFFQTTLSYGLFSAKAIDAAAADARRGGAEEGMNSLELLYVVPKVLGDMLNIKVAGESLLSDHALINVMRATVSDEALAEETLAWAAEGLSINSQERVYRAMGLALIDLQHDLTPSRYDEQIFANDAVAAVATLMGRIVPKHMWTELQKEPWCKQLVSCGLLPAHFARGTRIQIDAL